MAAWFMVLDKSSTLLRLMGGVVGSIAVGLCVYGACSYITKSPELRRMFVEAGRDIGKK